MLAVLGIDAAWTQGEPSGVALLGKVVEGWRCVAVAPSYDAFVDLSNGIPVQWAASPKGSAPNPANLLAAARKLLDGQTVGVVAVDIPVANVAITGRRVADNVVSKQFGGRGCGTHSPSANRPGIIGTQLQAGFAGSGYGLATAGTAATLPMDLIEVYPHPALLRLMSVGYRIKYKVSKSKRYWPNDTLHDRKENLLEALSEIIAALKVHIGSISLNVPDVDGTPTLSSLKPYEDAIDALVCAWVGTQYLAGNVKCYGDATAAIWVPCEA